MSFTPKNWQNSPATATPLNAVGIEDIETRLSDYTDTEVAAEAAARAAADALLAPLASPALTGNPTAPTPTAGDNDTSIATTAFVTDAVATGGGGGGTPEAWSALHLHDPAVDGGVSIKFQNYGAYPVWGPNPASPTPGYYKSPDDIVRLRGTVYAPTVVGTYTPGDQPIIAHLVSGYEPATNVSCLAWCQTTAEGKVLVLVIVTTAGLVKIGSYVDNGVFAGGFDSGSKFSLDSIEFRAA